MNQRAPTSIDRSIGARIRERRNELGVTQRELADAVAVTFQQVQKYEEATNRITAGRLYEFANVLDVEIGYFFENAERARKPLRKRRKPRKKKAKR
jgi:transcriptional regulator with XRE-family HTH domain